MIGHTLINHSVRLELGLSMVEYALADLIYHLCNNKKNAVGGWCYATKDSMCEMIGVSRRSIFRTLDRLESDGLIEYHPQTKNIRTTQKWYDVAIALTVPKWHSDSAKVALNNNIYSDNTYSINTVRTDKPSVARIIVSSRGTKKREYGNKEVNRLLELYEKHMGSKPTDKKVRNITATFVKQILAFIEQIKPYRSDLSDFETVAVTVFDWYDKKFGEVQTYTMDSVRRHVVNTCFHNTLKSAKADSKSDF